jgi:hypothetical protein
MMAHRANRWLVGLIFMCLTGCSEQPVAPVVQSTETQAGVLETAHDSLISGWAWRTDDPDDPVDVELLDGQTLIATVKADHFRQDLLDSKIGNGKHSFEFPTPESLKDGKPHEIHARIAGTGFVLKDSPKSYQFQSAGSSSPQ